MLLFGLLSTHDFIVYVLSSALIKTVIKLQKVVTLKLYINVSALYPYVARAFTGKSLFAQSNTLQFSPKRHSGLFNEKVSTTIHIACT